MIEAFLFGFWAIWTSDREIKVIPHSIAFIVVVIIIRGLMAFEFPHITPAWLATRLLEFILVAIVFKICTRVNGFGGTLIVATLGATVFYAIGKYVHLLPNLMFMNI